MMLGGSDFMLAFPGRSVLCTLHHHKQLWWTTTDENVIDAVVQPDDLREELARRLAYARTKDRAFSDRRHGVPPV